MELSTDKNIKISKQYFGKEQAPILVIDNFVAESEALLMAAKESEFVQNSPFYPGPRAAAPEAYQQLVLNTLTDQLVAFFELPTSNFTFSACHFSIIATLPNKLKLLQRIPHFDSLGQHGLAAVHYLFKEDLGGTSFYRHRKTGFESINEDRKIEYFRSLESENDGPNLPKSADGYINGDTALFERISEQPAKFNRIIIYRRNSLHSGSIPKHYLNNGTSVNPRLTISSFIDCNP
jgi:hypothetical protein